MAILTIDKKIFEKEIGKATDDLQNKIALFGTPVEDISDSEVQIEIFPNRPDLLSYQNFKKSFLSFLGKNTGLREIKIKKSNYKLIVESSIPKEWPFAFACVVKGLKFDDNKIKEVIDIQEKIGLTLLRKRKKGGMGLYPLEKITFPVKFKGMAPDKIKFRPLEFPNEITGKQILVKHPTGREYADIVEGWSKFPVFVDAKNKIMSMPPIINSHEVGKIDHTTKDVFLEVTGNDEKTLKSALNIMVAALEGIGGEVYSISCENKGKKQNIPDLTPIKTKLSLINANNLLGLNLKESEISKLLGKMGHDYKAGKVLSPAWRTDILHEVDLIEDIAIAYGYDNFIPEIPEISGVGEIDAKEILKQKIAGVLIGLGFLETSSYHLINKDTIKNMSQNPKEFIKVNNSKTEYEFLRKDLTSYLMKIFGENVDVEYPHNLFQIGRVFDEYEEKERLAIGLTPGNFTSLKQILEYLGNSLGIEFNVRNPESIPGHFIEGRVAEIILNDKEIGFFGEVNPKILKNFKLKMPAVILEMDLEEVFNSLN